METRIATAEDPTSMGRTLTGSLTGLWRYRVGDYRLVYRIQKEILIVLVVAVGHRRHLQPVLIVTP